MRTLILAAAFFSTSASAGAGHYLLNQVTADELKGIDGVEEGEAQRIIALRSKRQRLSSVEELRILGLDQKTLTALRSHLATELTLKKVAKGSYTSVEEVLGQFSNEPDVLKVQALTMDYTKTNPAMVEGWLKASTAAYALPAVTLSYDKDMDDYTTWDYLDLNEDGDIRSNEHQFNTARADDDQGFGVRLAWRLDKLVMSSERIRVINEAQDIVKLRDKVLDEVTRVYFDRRRLQVDQLLSPSSGLREQIKNELRLQELTASIDALTGGEFSAALGR
jgi:hypothetical protein